MPRHSCAVWTTGPNRRRYRSAGTIWLLADRASAHTAARTQMLAAALDIRFLWLPKQAPELNAMDQLWRELKRLIDPAWAVLKASRIGPGWEHEACGHAQAAGGGARGTSATGDRAAPGRPDLWCDRGAGWADPDRGVRHLQAVCRAGC